MAYKDFLNYIDTLIEIEGGYVNSSIDRGGETKYGISKKAFPNEDIKNLNASKTKDLYFKYYWVPGRCSDVPQYLRYIHFDSCVHHGPFGAIKILQRAIGTVTVDGIFGNETFSSVHLCKRENYIAQRSLYMSKIVVRDTTQLGNLIGWNNRLIKILEVK